MEHRLARPEGIEGYKQEVDRALTASCGVSYSTLVEEMAPCMDKDSALLLTGAARGYSPEDFARAFERAHKLSRVDAAGAEWAERFNLSRAALVAFGSEARGWRAGTDGRAYKALAEGTVLRLDVANKGNLWGFAVSESEAPVDLVHDPADPFARVRPPAVPFRKLAARMDIGDAVTDALRIRLEHAAEPAAPLAAPGR